MAVYRWIAGHLEMQHRISYRDHGEILQAPERPGALVSGVASHLKHPLRGRMSCQAGEGDPTRFQMDEKQDVVSGETSPSKHLNGEEISTRQDGEVGGDEIAPSDSLAAF